MLNEMARDRLRAHLRVWFSVGYGRDWDGQIAFEFRFDGDCWVIHFRSDHWEVGRIPLTDGEQLVMLRYGDGAKLSDEDRAEAETLVKLIVDLGTEARRREKLDACSDAAQGALEAAGTGAAPATASG